MKSYLSFLYYCVRPLRLWRSKIEKDLSRLRVEVKRSNMASSRSSISKIAQAYCFQLQRRGFSSKPSYSSSAKEHRQETNLGGDDDDAAVPTAGISRPLSEVLKDLNKKVPESLIKSRVEEDFSIRYIPWYFSLSHSPLFFNSLMLHFESFYLFIYSFRVIDSS